MHIFAPQGCFSESFLNYLRDFEFECDVWAVPEGTPVFPGEPLVTVAGPMIQAQFVETMILLTINHQTLIATKANRITRAAEGRTVLEFGSRRAQGYDGAILGARAAYIGGCQGTACVLSDRDYKIPAGGTMAHSWVQMFDSEYEAFKAYADIYPDNCVFLVDTYNVLQVRCAERNPRCQRNWKRRRASAHAASVWIPAISLTFLSRPAKCSMPPALRTCRSWRPIRLMSILFATCSCRVPA